MEDFCHSASQTNRIFKNRLVISVPWIFQIAVAWGSFSISPCLSTSCQGSTVLSKSQQVRWYCPVPMEFECESASSIQLPRESLSRGGRVYAWNSIQGHSSQAQPSPVLGLNFALNLTLCTWVEDFRTTVQFHSQNSLCNKVILFWMPVFSVIHNE